MKAMFENTAREVVGVSPVIGGVAKPARRMLIQTANGLMTMFQAAR